MKGGVDRDGGSFGQNSVFCREQAEVITCREGAITASEGEDGLIFKARLRLPMIFASVGNPLPRNVQQ